MNQKSEHNYEIDFILVVNWFLNNSIISQTVRRLLILVTKKCRIYAACGVSQTPTGNENKEEGTNEKILFVV